MGRKVAQAAFFTATFITVIATSVSPLTVRAEDAPPLADVKKPEVSTAAAPNVERNSSSAESKVEQQDPAAPISHKPRALFQHATYPAAWKAAQQSNRPILVFVSMPKCHYCVKMKQQVLCLPHVKQLVAESFETISADRSTHGALVQQLQVKWYPTTVLVGPNNKVIDVIEGYANANEFQQRLQTGLASLRRTTELAQLAENQSK